MAKRARYVPQSPSLVQPLLQESNMDQSENWLREIKDEADLEIKIKISQKSINGEDFTRPLHKILKTLEQIANRLGRRGSLSDDYNSTLNIKLKSGLQSLLSERLMSLIMYMQCIATNVDELGRLLLDVLSYLMLLDCVPVLSYPTLFASVMLQLRSWSGGSHEVMISLCHYALPMTYLPMASGITALNDSMCGTSTLMIALEEKCATPRDQIMLVETIMFLKRDVCTDLLSVVGCGSKSARDNAVKLFLHYWPLGFPDTTPDPFDPRDWPKLTCNRSECQSEAAMLCLDGRCTTTFHKKFSSEGRKKLFLLLCLRCHEVVHKTNDHPHKIVMFPQQLSEVRLECNMQEACSGSGDAAMVTCYADSCRGSRCEVPVRMCEQCHRKRHEGLVDGEDDDHIYQVGPYCPWSSKNKAASSALLEAVTKLLDVEPDSFERKESRRSTSHQGSGARYSLKKETLCKHGLMILRQYCTPLEQLAEIEEEAWLVQLVALVLEWLVCCHQVVRRLADSATIELTQDQWSPVVTFVPDLDHVCSNYRELTMLVDEHAVPWLIEVCRTDNMGCIAKALLPNLPKHAQVGSLWQWSCDSMKRYQRTLSKLALLVRTNILPEDALFQVYNEVMPQWMDLLVELRSHPGKMECLKQELMNIFTTSKQETHGKRIKRFEFIREKFLMKNTSGRQRALFWLQDLSRLSVPVPYTSHIFEDSLQRRTLPRHAASLEQTESVGPMDHSVPLLRRGSTGSMSGYESESALVSQVSFQITDTHAVLQLNFALPRYILMLDIWLSQLNLNAEGVPLEYSQLLRFLSYMLGRDWSTSNTIQHDYHHDSTNMCLFCQAIALWFSFASRIIAFYVKKEQAEAESEPPSSPVLERPEVRRGRTSIKVFAEALTGKPKRKKTQLTETVSVTSGRTPASTPGDDRDTEEFVFVSRREGGDEREGVPIRSTPDMGLRRVALQKGRCRPGESPSGSPSHKRDSLTALYTVFQLCIKKLNHQRTQLHPDAKHQIVNCLKMLLNKADVLSGIDMEVVMKDLKNLFDKLWKIMECETSYLARSCVQLLLDCQRVMVNHKIPPTTSSFSPTFSSSLTSTHLWTTIEQSGKSSPFRTIDKVFLILQFMVDPASPDHAPHVATQLTVAYGFCWLVQQLHSGDSHVSVRAHYCIPSLSHSSLEVIKGYLVQMFLMLAGYRTIVLQTLHILNTSLPRLPFLSVLLINDLMDAITGIMNLRDLDDLVSLATRLQLKQPKMSNASMLSRPSVGRLSIASSAMSAVVDEEGRSLEHMQLQCDVVALLLKYVANVKSDFNTSLSEFVSPANRQNTKKTDRRQVSEESVQDLVTRLKEIVLKQYTTRERSPLQLRHSRMYETFLIHMHKALDLNTQFGETDTLHKFILRLLGYSSVPTKEDYRAVGDFVHLIINTPKSHDHNFTLGYIPTHLQAQWLRLLFVILYKYADKASSEEALPHLKWCVELIVNSLHYSAHNCPAHLATASEPGQSELPPFRRPLKPPVGLDLQESGGESPLRPRIAAAVERPSLATVPEEGGHSAAPSKSSLLPDQDVPPTASRRPVAPSLSTASMTSTITSCSTMDMSCSMVAQDSGLCAVCHKPCEEFSEEVVALCVVCLGTLTHRLPNLASPHLVNGIIPCIAKVVVPDHYHWQSGSASSPPPGSAMAVARQFLLTILTQFADRYLFLYFFKEDHKNLTDTIFTAIAACFDDREGAREEGEGTRNQLNVTSPVQYLIENACQYQQFTTSIVTTHTLTNLACYLEKLSDSQSPLFLKLTLFDTFLKRLKEHTDKILHDQDAFYALLRIILFLLKSCDSLSPHVQQTTLIPSSNPTTTSASLFPVINAIFQELPILLEGSLQNVYLPVGGLVMLAGLWGRIFQQTTARRRKHVLLKLIVDHFAACVKGNSSLLPENMLALTQTLIIGLESVAYLGYVDVFTDQRIHASRLQHDSVYELHFSSVIASESSTTGVEATFSEAMKDSLRFLAFEQPKSTSPNGIKLAAQVKLTLSLLTTLRISRQRNPLSLLEKIIQGRHTFSVEEKSGKPSGVPRGRDVHVSGREHISALQVICWLFLGTMSNNIIHNALSLTQEHEKSREYRDIHVETTECEILSQLRCVTEKHEAIPLITEHVIKSIIFLSERASAPYWGIQCVFMFCSVLTMYMELYLPHPLPDLMEFWQIVVDKLVNLPVAKEAMLSDDLLVESFTSSVLVPLKMADISCFPLLLPTWRRVVNLLHSTEKQWLTTNNLLQTTLTISTDEWLMNTLLKFTNLEYEYLAKEYKDQPL